MKKTAKPKISEFTTEKFEGLRKVVIREDEDGTITDTRIIQKKKNPKKVILDTIGDFQLYVYPYEYPDKVFFGCYPKSVSLDRNEIKKFLSLFNRARWFLKEFWTEKREPRTKGAKRLREYIRKSYAEGLLEQQSKKQP